MTVAIALVIIIILAVFAGLVVALAHYATHVKRQGFEEAYEWQKQRYDTGFYEEAEKVDYRITSYDGYVLPVQLIINPVHTDKYVLITHGHTDNHYGMLKYTKMYMDFGFNVIIYDIRGHGENERTICTFSIREARDLDVLIKDCRTRYPDMTVFGIHGESLGAATSVAVLKYKPDIDFVVADCGFAEIISVMQGGLKQWHLPQWLVYPASLFSRFVYGYSFLKMRPIDSLKDNTIPVLFMHGGNDTYITPSHSERMNAATQGYSEFHIIPGAEHAGSVLTAPDDYRKYVEGFLKAIHLQEEK